MTFITLSTTHRHRVLRRPAEALIWRRAADTCCLFRARRAAADRDDRRQLGLLSGALGVLFGQLQLDQHGRGVYLLLVDDRPARAQRRLAYGAYCIHARGLAAGADPAPDYRLADGALGVARDR